MNTDDLCFPPVDPYAEAKAAFADGELEILMDGEWKHWRASVFGTPAFSSRAEKYRRRPKNDGWIEWKGGECPIPHAMAGEYEVRLRVDSPENMTGAEYPALHAWWRHEGRSHDIIAYRLKPATAATVDGWDLGHFPTGQIPTGHDVVIRAQSGEPIPAAEDRKTAQEYAAALNGDDDPVQDTDRPGIANAAMYRAMTTPKPAKPEPRGEPGLLVVAPMGTHARGWGL